MRSKFWLLHRGSVAVVVLAVGGLALAGCSVLGPEPSWNGSDGTIEGTITSDAGKEVGGIEVTLWGGIDEACDPIEYCATSAADGTYSLTSVEIGGTHAYECTYEMYVNRTPSSATPIDSSYGTYVATVTVSVNGTWHDVTIVEAEPGPPDNYFE